MNNNTRQPNRQERNSPTGPLRNVKLYETANGKRSGRGGGNVFIISDLKQLARHRRWLGSWEEADMVRILRIIAPRQAQVVRQETPEQAFLRIVREEFFELLWSRDAAWIESLRVEAADPCKRGNFPSTDDIAGILSITEEEVTHCRFCTLRARGNTKTKRRAASKKRNRERKREVTVENNGTPQDQSLAARHRRGEFGKVSLKTVRRWIAAGKIDPDSSTFVPMSTFPQSSSQDAMSTFPQAQNLCSKGIGGNVDIPDVSSRPTTSENSNAVLDHQKMKAMETRSIFIRTAPTTLAIKHGTGIEGTTVHLDYRDLRTASFPIQGKMVAGAVAPTFFIPAINGRVVEVVRS